MPFRGDEDAKARAAATRTVGRYAIYGEIAAGGMATVHFGRILGAGGFTRPVAIKQLHPQFANDAAFRARFIDEAWLVSRIRHQNVVPTLDVVAAEDELFLVVEYVQGESLWRLMKAAHDRRVRVPPAIAITIATQVLHGLHAAHEAKDEKGAPLGIVHRDVSPQNILVGTDGAARVLDFGVARASSREEPSPEEKIHGKLSYMAPEQIAGAIVGRQADIYATAVVLWELLAGRRLFQRGDPQTLLVDKLFRTNVPRPSALNEHVPRAIDVVVMKALAREPAERFATAREMSIALESGGKLAPASEVGEWVERIAHDALAKRARQIADFERRSLPAAREFVTASMSPLVSSIHPFGKTLKTPSPELAPGTVIGRGAEIERREAGEGLPSSRRKRGRLSLASLLEPDLEANALHRMRLLSFERKRIVAASVLAVGAFVGTVALARVVGSRGAPERAASSRRVDPVQNVLLEPVVPCPRGMATIPGGRFFMGSDDDQPAERPAHHVTLAPYCIDIFEVTTDDYRACADRGDCRRASATNEWGGVSATDHRNFDGLCNIRDSAGRGRHPINCVDWDMASQYCAARGARLPTEAEWEFAARGSDGRRYPWGDEAPSPHLLNACGKECLDWGRRNHVDEAAMYTAADGWATTAPIGSFPDGKSKYGVQDLIGNVWEWVSDYFAPYDADAQENPHGPAGGRERVIRGGAWNGAYADWMRPTFRYHDPPETKSYGIGFRCAAAQGAYSTDARSGSN